MRIGSSEAVVCAGVKTDSAWFGILPHHPSTTMSWGRGVHNEKLKRSQRLALASTDEAGGGDGDSSSGYQGMKVELRVLQFGADIDLSSPTVTAGGLQAAYCSPLNAEQWGITDAMQRGEVFVYVRTYAQVLQKLKPHRQVPAGHIVFTEVQRQNLEVTRQDTFNFTIVSQIPHSVGDLLDVCLDARPRHHAPLADGQGGAVVVDAKELTRVVLGSIFGLVASTNERYVVVHKGIEWILTVTEVHIDVEDWDDELSIPDIKNGRISTDTKIYISPEDPEQEVPQYILQNLVPRPQQKGFSDIVDITCNDEETFPVRKKLLTPCIKLTSVVAAGLGKYKQTEGATETHAIRARVDIDCLTFDRCLLYLESECRGKGDEHDFEAQYNEDMLAAARKLGCRGLEDLCLKKMGAFESRVRKEYIRWNEILKRNEEQEEVILVMDGMVYDVTRWLPEHPGGNTIIPKQALGKDSTKFFELYHSSRKSFMYLKEFYIGEIHPSDLESIPPASKGKPSVGFLEQLREFTVWRVKAELAEKGHKSF